VAEGRTVLFCHQKLLFYRVPVYNKLSEALARHGLKLVVWPLGIHPAGYTVRFETLSLPLTLHNYVRVLRKLRPAFVMCFLNRRDVGLFLYTVIPLLARLSGAESIYYGHGLNLNRKGKASEIILSNTLHFLFNKIILYSPNELRYLWKIHRRRVSIAYNTLDLKGRRALVKTPKQVLRGKLGFKESFVVLFCGRIEPRKRLDVLLDLFSGPLADRKDMALAVVGPGLTPPIAARMKRCPRVRYFGAVYDPAACAEIFAAADVFCIPGHLGLGLVEAFFWGLPVLTMTEEHAPEAYYLHPGENGFVCRDPADLARTLQRLASEPDLLEKLSRNARATYESEAKLERMLAGYLKALEVPEADVTFQSAGCKPARKL